MPKSTKSMLTIAMIAVIVSAGVVWASNNVAPVKNVIGS